MNEEPIIIPFVCVCDVQTLRKVMPQKPHFCCWLYTHTHTHIPITTNDTRKQLIIGISFYSVWLWMRGWMRSTTTWLLSIQWITFPFCFHYLPDIHHCFWLLWLSLFISMYEKTNFVLERRWEDGRVQIHWQWNSLFLEWPIVMAWCVCVSGNHEHYHIAETKWHLWNKIYDDQFCQWRMEKTQKWNNVYFKMHFWLILKR